MEVLCKFWVILYKGVEQILVSWWGRVLGAMCVRGHIPFSVQLLKDMVMASRLGLFKAELLQTFSPTYGFISLIPKRNGGSCGNRGFNVLRHCQTFPKWLLHFMCLSNVGRGSGCCASSSAGGRGEARRGLLLLRLQVCSSDLEPSVGNRNPDTAGEQVALAREASARVCAGLQGMLSLVSLSRT